MQLVQLWIDSSHSSVVLALHMSPLMDGAVYEGRGDEHWQQGTKAHCDAAAA